MISLLDDGLEPFGFEFLARVRCGLVVLIRPDLHAIQLVRPGVRTNAGNFFCCKACANASASSWCRTAATWSMIVPFGISGPSTPDEGFAGIEVFDGAVAVLDGTADLGVAAGWADVV